MVEKAPADVWVVDDAVASREALPWQVSHRLDPVTPLPGKSRDLDEKSLRRLLPCSRQRDPVFSGLHSPACWRLQPEHGVTGDVPDHSHTHLLLERLVCQRGDEQGWIEG